jgi:hypothetical protein
MTQQLPSMTAMQTFQGLQGIAGQAQNQRIQQQQAEMQRTQFEQQQQAAQAQAERQALLQERLQGVVNPETGQLDPQGFTNLLLTDPATAKAVREQFGLVDEQRNEQALNQAFAVKQILDMDDPAMAAEAFVRNGLDQDPVYGEMMDNLLQGDIEGARNELRYGVAAMGGPERFNQIFGDTSGGGFDIGQFNPRDYTPESFSEFIETQNPRVLERFSSQQSVDIGGVPHVFDPRTGGYMPAQLGGAPQRPMAEEPQGQQMPPQLVAPPEARAITPEDVASNRATIAEAEANARLPANLLAQGLRLTEDGNLDIVPGSRLDRDMQEANTKTESQQQLTARSGNTLIQDLGRGIEMIDDSRFASGTLAAMTPRRINRPAQRLQAMVDSIESNVSVNSLNEMRNSSPTGGALGNVSDKQSALLAGLLGNLDITQEPEVLKDNMKRIQNIFLDIVHGVGQGPERQRLGFDHLGRRVEGGVPWIPDPEVITLERENQSTQRAPQQQQQQRTPEQEADDFINSILGL